MKIIVYIVVGLILLTIFAYLSPLIIGGGIAYLCFSSGSAVAGTIVFAIAFIWQAAIFVELGVFDNGLGGGRGRGGSDDECPFCGGGDTDGNHCHTCGKDY